MKTANLLIVAMVAVANLVVWAAPHAFELVPRAPEPLHGVSFSPFRAGRDPLAGRLPSAEQIDQDLQLLEGHVASVRTYSSTGGLEQVPRLARRRGLRVTAGAWPDGDLAHKELELAGLVASVRASDNVDGVSPTKLDLERARELQRAGPAGVGEAVA